MLFTSSCIIVPSIFSIFILSIGILLVKFKYTFPISLPLSSFPSAPVTSLDISTFVLPKSLLIFKFSLSISKLYPFDDTTFPFIVMLLFLNNHLNIHYYYNFHCFF